MADNSAIEWTEATWQPITGCSIVSPGCTNCYAMRLAGTRLKHIPSRIGLTTDSKAGPVWNGQVRFNGAWLLQPLQWKRPRKIFVCAHGDLFHESVPDEWIDRVFAVMALAPQHTFQVLTKRAGRMRRYVAVWCDEAADRIVGSGVADWSNVPNEPLPNVWLGVSAERQHEADERIPQLIETPAAVRWISAEPLLGPINLFDFIGPWNPTGGPSHAPPQLDLIVAGGESGTGARPMHPEWARGLRDQCAAAGVPFFFKQWGQWSIGERVLRNDGHLDYIKFQDGDQFHVVSDGHDIVLCGADDLKVPTHLWRDYWADGHGNLAKKVGKKAAGRLLDGVEHNGMPERAA